MFLWFCNLICRQKLMNRNCNLLKKERSIPFPCSLMGANPARHMRGHWRKRWDAWGWRKTLRVWKAIDECRVWRNPEIAKIQMMSLKDWVKQTEGKKKKNSLGFLELWICDKIIVRKSSFPVSFKRKYIHQGYRCSLLRILVMPTSLLNTVNN